MTRMHEALTRRRHLIALVSKRKVKCTFAIGILSRGIVENTLTMTGTHRCF